MARFLDTALQVTGANPLLAYLGGGGSRGVFGVDSLLDATTPIPTGSALLANLQRQRSAATTAPGLGAPSATAAPSAGTSLLGNLARQRAQGQPAQQAKAQATTTFSPQAEALAGAFPDLAQHGQRIGQAVAETGVPAQVWMAAIAQESGGRADIVNPRTLATGLLQALPTESPSGAGRGYGFSSRDLMDPDLNLRLAYGQFRNAWNALDEARSYGWNVDDPVERAVWTIARAQGYGADAQGSGAAAFRLPQAPANQAFRQHVQRAYASAPTATAAAFGGVSQNELGLPSSVAAAFCGPAAAMWFVQKTGRTPTVEEALNLAREVGWSGGGMGGPARAVTLIQRLGGQASLGPVNPARIAGEVSQGRPVIIDTPDHYYQVVGYDAASGRFRFGDAVGRTGGWMTLDQLPALGYGAARTAIFLGQ